MPAPASPTHQIQHPVSLSKSQPMTPVDEVANLSRLQFGATAMIIKEAHLRRRATDRES